MDPPTVIFNVFGSPSSSDLDIFVAIGAPVAKPHLAGDLAHHLEDQLRPVLNRLGITKELDCNVGTVVNGVITWVYKGTPDEVNNSLYETYSYNFQLHPPLVMRRLPRNLTPKLIRTPRVLLSAITQTNYRDDVKAAMKGNLRQKIEVLSVIRFEDLKFKPEYTLVQLLDIRKDWAFQLAQTLALMKGFEIYTKEAAAQRYPDLARFLFRDPQGDVTILSKYLEKLLVSIKLYADTHPELWTLNQITYR